MQCTYCAASQEHLGDTGWRKASFSLFVCRRCGNTFIFPLLTERELDTYYQHSYLNRTEAHVAVRENSLTDFYYLLIQRWHPHAALIYEVGCSEGDLLYGLEQRGFAVKGFELSRRSAELGEKVFGVPIAPTPLPRAQAKKADVLISSHVVEHLRDPKGELAAYANNLKSGGIAIVVTPNFKSLWFRIFRYHHPWFAPPDHLLYFDVRSLAKDLTDAGFQVESSFTRNDKYSLLAMFALALLNTWKEWRKPQAQAQWQRILTEPENRPLPASTLKSRTMDGIRRCLDVLSAPIGFLTNSLGLGDELCVVARKQ